MNDKINIENSQVNNPLHGIRLIDILDFLVEEYGWEELGNEININCFTNNPSIKSSLKFLRKSQWAGVRWSGFILIRLRNKDSIK